MPAALLALVDAMRRHFAEGIALGGAVGAEAALVAERLSGLPEPAPLPTPGGHPALRHLDPLLAAVPPLLDGALTAALAARLPWRFGYAPRPDAPGLGDNMAWAELVGPAAPLHSDQVGFGLTLIGPATHYLPHRHPAVELYAVVSGTARWTAAGRAAAHPPGSFILHPADVVHAMQTADQALLAIYSWSGDIVSPSVYAEG